MSSQLKVSRKAVMRSGQNKASAGVKKEESPDTTPGFFNNT
jgi:hypothetical protein